jgi:hypothetical protein
VQLEDARVQLEDGFSGYTFKHFPLLPQIRQHLPEKHAVHDGKPTKASYMMRPDSLPRGARWMALTCT